MTNFQKSTLLALALGAASFTVNAGDLIGTIGKGKGGRTTVALDLVNDDGNASVFEFVVNVGKGAKNVDVSKCLVGLPSTHVGKCQHNPDDGEVIGIAYSPSAAVLPKGIVGLGQVSFNGTLLKGGNGATIRGLQVGNRLGEEIPSSIQIEDALLGK